MEATYRKLIADMNQMAADVAAGRKSADDFFAAPKKSSNAAKARSRERKATFKRNQMQARLDRLARLGAKYYPSEAGSQVPAVSS